MHYEIQAEDKLLELTDALPTSSHLVIQSLKLTAGEPKYVSNDATPDDDVSSMISKKLNNDVASVQAGFPS